MALINTLMRLKETRVVDHFDLIDKTRANVKLINGNTIIVYMAEDYVVGTAAIGEASTGEPKPDYIVYNNWDKVTDEAHVAAKAAKIPLVSYGRFRYILDELLFGSK